jgi:hypothetical protein
MGADLVRRAVINAQSVGTAANIDAERFPGEGLLEYPLAEIAGQEHPVGSRCSNSSQEAQLGNADILRLIDDGEIEHPFATVGDVIGQPAEHIGPGDDVAPHQLSADPLEHRP